MGILSLKKKKKFLNYCLWLQFVTHIVMDREWDYNDNFHLCLFMPKGFFFFLKQNKNCLQLFKLWVRKKCNFSSPPILVYVWFVPLLALWHLLLLLVFFFLLLSFCICFSITFHVLSVFILSCSICFSDYNLNIFIL